jgi:hypothetical protein
MEIDLSTLEVGDFVEFRNGYKEDSKYLKINETDSKYIYYFYNRVFQSYHYKNGNDIKCFRKGESNFDIIKIIKKEKPVEKRKFKVGDKVRCIDNKNGKLSLTLNRIYKVNYITDDETMIGISNDNNLSDGYDVKRFELIEESTICPVCKGKAAILSPGLISCESNCKQPIKDFSEVKNPLKDAQLSEKHIKWLKEQEEFPIICPPLKPEDLEVGMVFEWVTYYSKIINIYKNNIFIEMMRKDDNEMHCNYYPIDTFLKFNKLIDKVPPKIVEVEEEVPIYMDKENFKRLQEEGYINSLKAINFLNISIEGYKFFDGSVELCKIKRTVKKELNWSWDEGVWK